MKVWIKPEVTDLSFRKTEHDPAGGRNDGGWISNPSNPNANPNADQMVPGHS